VPSTATSPKSPIPHAPITPKEFFPLSSHQSFGYPTSLPRGTCNRLYRKSLSAATNAQHTREQFLAKLSPRDFSSGSSNHSTTTNLSPKEISHGPSTRFFDNETLNATPTTPYKLIVADKVIIEFFIQFDPLLFTRDFHMNNKTTPPKKYTKVSNIYRMPST